MPVKAPRHLLPIQTAALNLAQEARLDSRCSVGALADIPVLLSHPWRTPDSAKLGCISKALGTSFRAAPAKSLTQCAHYLGHVNKRTSGLSRIFDNLFYVFCLGA